LLTLDVSKAHVCPVPRVGKIVNGLNRYSHFSSQNWFLGREAILDVAGL
jgi:hypothetical protein